jgi:L-methionine (R)-S-oxide reductase
MEAPSGRHFPQRDSLGDDLRRVLASVDSRATKAERAAALIRRAGPYRWVGIYEVLPEEIAVIAWSGPGAPAHPRFPRTAGLNGAAVGTGEPVIVQDVASDPRYLTTLSGTRAEAVIPVKSAAGEVVGTIDVESERADAFTDADRTLLEACAAALAPLWT